MQLTSSVLASVLLALAPSLSAQGRIHTVDDGKPDYGAVWHLDLSASGSVQEQLEIAEGQAGFEGIVDLDTFGSSVAAIGDLDNDFTADLAVGAPGDDTGGNWRGAVWLLFRDADGTIASGRALRSGDVPLENGDGFGSALAFLGDLDGDLRPELAVGAPGHGVNGGFWILSLGPDGSVADRRLVTEGQSGFGGDLASGDGFGASLAAIGDLDGDAVPDLAVGAPGDDDGVGQESGALWILFLNWNGTVKAELKISRTSGGFGSGALNTDRMGSSVSPLGDLDDDGIVDLALGAPGTGTTGGVWILFLNADGTVRAKQLISSSSGGLSNLTQHGFGAAIAPLGDLDADGIEDLAVGAPDTGAGAVFALALNANGTVKAQRRLESSIAGLVTGDRLGSSLSALGDLDGDGRADLAVGAPGRDGINDADFTDVQAAVDAAVDGDTLLVRRGTYADTTVSAKALTILGDRAGTVRVNMRVENLAASQTVALHRLLANSSYALGAGWLRLADNAGLVWVEECAVQATLSIDGAPGLSVRDCARVVLVRSSFEASSDGSTLDFDMPPIAYAGVALTGSSTLHAYDCTFTGAWGGVHWDSWCELSVAQQGGPGLAASADSFVFLSHCTVNGGDGILHTGQFQCAHLSLCSDGGTGLANAGEAIVLDSELTGGTGGPCADGADVTGPVQILPGEGLSFTMSQLGRERDDVTFTFQGPPFRPVYLGGSPMPRATFLPALRGSLLVGMPRAIELLGFTDGAGHLEVVRSIGLLPPSADIRRVYLQPFYFAPDEPAGRITLGAGALYIVLDERF